MVERSRVFSVCTTSQDHVLVNWGTRFVKAGRNAWPQTLKNCTIATTKRTKWGTTTTEELEELHEKELKARKTL
jgi:hypothetical protein